MSRYVFKMPDLGEGTVSAEVVAWHVKPGDLVQEDQVMCEVMTEKAAVEMPAPVTGRILSIQGEPGDMVAVGSELVVFDTDATSAAAGDAPAAKTPPPAPAEPLTPHRRATDKQPGEKQASEIRLRRPRPMARTPMAKANRRGSWCRRHRAAAPSRPGSIYLPSPAPGPRAASSRATSIPRWPQAPRAVRRRR